MHLPNSPCAVGSCSAPEHRGLAGWLPCAMDFSLVNESPEGHLQSDRDDRTLFLALFLLYEFSSYFTEDCHKCVSILCADNCTLHWIQTPNPGSLSSLLGALWEGEEVKAQLLKFGI